MIYISAGHHYDENGADPGAVRNGIKEADLTIEFRDLVCKQLDILGAKYITDKDTETLVEYISRIKPGSGSVLCEFHFNAGPASANGIEVIVKDGAGKPSYDLANEICNAGVKIVGLNNRGVKEEKDTARKRIGILRTAAGISILPELCFISSDKDMSKWNTYKLPFALQVAQILKRYDDMYN
jgi:N-acetylmuramoyl-L-alanine amidase